MRDILFIAFQFPPMGGPGVQRSAQFVKYLRNYNYNPIVFTIKEEDIKQMDVSMDYSLLNNITKDVEIIRTNSALPFKLIKLLTKLRLYRLFWFWLYPFFWERSALWPFSSYKVAKQIVLDKKINVVYTTSAPYSTMILGLLLKKRLKIKWVADLRDPFTNAYFWSFPSKFHWFFAGWVENWMLKKPDILIVNTPEVKKYYIKKFNLQENKVRVLTNGY